MKTILYIHGMGGGEDSRIPSILNDWFGAHQPDIHVVVRTYDFHPDRAAAQIDTWYAEGQPDLVIGESLGSVHALALYSRLHPGCGSTAPLRDRETYPSGGISLRSAPLPQPANAEAMLAPPLLLVSPALNAPKFLYALRGLARIPLIHRWLNHIYKPREGRRQALDFAPETLTAWGAYRLFRRPQDLTPAHVYAFFGRRDHYRRSGVVSLKQWRRTFGPGTYALYDGTHYMEEAYLQELLIPAILERI